MALSPVTILGQDGPGGVYLLRIQVAKNASIRFGQYRLGGLLEVEIRAGEYVYVGSAQGQRGSTTLASRLLRHTARTENKPSHLIQIVLADRLQSEGLDGAKPKGKSMHWHVDYLLDLETVEISHVIAFRSKAKIEARLAAMIEAMPETIVFAPGLGASDQTGSTHLLWVEADEKWWNNVADLFVKELV
jgi:Uri superfamily endonuclease